MWRQAIFLDSFDLYGADILHRELERQHVQLTEDEIAVLSTSCEASWLQKEEIRLAKIFAKYASGTDLEKDLLHSTPFEVVQKKYPAFDHDLQEHTKDFYWIAIDYARVVRKTPKDFYEKLCDTLQSKEERLRFFHIPRMLENVRKKREEIIQQKHLSAEVQHLFEMFITLMQMRDHRKINNQMGNDVIAQFVKEASRRTAIAVEDLERLWCTETKKLFSLDLEDIEILRKRTCCVVMTRSPEHYDWIYGQEAKDFYQVLIKPFLEVKELKGMPAQKGFVRGVARLIMNQDDFSKMQAGDILIASNTRPEYLPVMKIASAIVTEEGGITSHAAIVSRELQKPSIVGVQGVIFALKDGDKIEVDANRGFVKKISA
jgi:phosphoenolpyruvate synthase/pyruvate phosphate dikinase